MACWIMKSEPSVYGIQDLKKAGKDEWDGVRNYQARNFMRSMKLNDKAYFYHSNCETPGIVGLMTLVKEAYPDKTALNPKSKYFDSKSSSDNIRWSCVDVAFEKAYSDTLSLAELKETLGLEELPLVKKGSRLSIIPVSSKEERVIEKLLKKKCY